MRAADIAEVPGLGGDAGYSLLAALIALDKAVVRRKGAEAAADAVVGELGPDEVDVVGPERQIDGEAGLVLAAAGEGDVFARELLATIAHGAIPYLPLLGLRAPPLTGTISPAAPMREMTPESIAAARVSSSMSLPGTAGARTGRSMCWIGCSALTRMSSPLCIPPRMAQPSSP